MTGNNTKLSNAGNAGRPDVTPSLPEHDNSQGDVMDGQTGTDTLAEVIRTYLRDGMDYEQAEQYTAEIMDVVRRYCHHQMELAIPKFLDMPDGLNADQMDGFRQACLLMGGRLRRQG